MTLLAGHPFGADDPGALEFAGTLARSMATSLAVVTVVPAGWPTTMAEGTDREFDAWAREAGTRASADARALLDERFPDVDSEVRWVQARSVPGALIEQAEASGAQLIVVGSGHEGAYGRVQLGSTAQRLLHSAPMPVAIATRGHRCPDDGRVGRVSVAFRGDGTDHAVERTAQLSLAAGASLRLVTFAARGRELTPPLMSGGEDAVLAAWLEQARARQAGALADLDTAGLLPPGSDAAVATGRSLAAAVDSVEWRRDEILVVGSSPAGLLARTFLGSNGSRIVRLSPVGVIVVP